MHKEVLELIIKTITNGGRIEYETERKGIDSIVAIKMFNKNNDYINTVRFYYVLKQGITGILFDLKQERTKIKINPSLKDFK